MNGTIQYTIRPYDTIWMLAQIFNTTVDSIMDLNPGMDPRNLMIGQVITIRPGYQYYPSNSDRQGRPQAPGNNMNDLLEGGMMDEDMMDEDMMSPDRMSPDRMNQGRTSPERTSPERMNPDRMSPDRMNQGRTSPDRMNQDRMDQGRTSPERTSPDRMNQGRTAPERMSPDRTESDRMDYDLQDMCGNIVDLTNLFRMLWEEHAQWTALTILSMVQSLPEAEVFTQRLLRNPTDFADALAPFYGEEAASKFAQLLTTHLTIAAEIVNAAMSGDNNAMTDADRRWKENAEQIAALLGQLNPYWKDDDWSAMLSEHLTMVSNFADTLLSQDYMGAVSAYDEMIAQVLEMADMMAEGVIMQFPDE